MQISERELTDSTSSPIFVAAILKVEGMALNIFSPFTASHLFECVLESGICCYLVLHRRRYLLAWQMTRHVLLPAKLSERLRGGDGKFKQAARTTPEVGQTHKFLALEREASIM